MISTRLMRAVIVATHALLVCAGFAGIFGYGSSFITRHSIIGLVINCGLVLIGTLGCFSALSHDDELEVIALYLQSVLIGMWAFFILLDLVERGAGTWGGFFGISSWAFNLVLRAMWLSGVVKVVVSRDGPSD